MGACHKLVLSKGPPSPRPRAQKLYWHEAALPKHSTLSNPAFKSPPQKSSCRRSSGELGCGVPRHAVGCSALTPGGLWWLGTTSGILPALPVQPGSATAVMPLCGSALLPAWLGLGARSRERRLCQPRQVPARRHSCAVPPRPEQLQEGGAGWEGARPFPSSSPVTHGPAAFGGTEASSSRPPPLRHLHRGKCESDRLAVATGLMLFSWVSAGVKFLRHMQKSFLDCKAKGERRHSAQLLHSSPAWEGKPSPEAQSRSGTLPQEGQRLLFTPKPCSML